MKLNFSKLSDISHVYQIPDTYIGGTVPISRSVLLYKNQKYVEENTKLPEGVQRIFLEILSNAGDNTYASRKDGIDPGNINIEMNERIIKITNSGKHISLKKIKLIEEGKSKNFNVEETTADDPEGIWLPQMIFGELRTSNNYDTEKERMGCGRNGFGAKIVNIFSKLFVVEVEDPELKLRFKGVWKNNMFKNDQSLGPEIFVEKDDKITKGKVSIAWELDFERFKMEKYTPKDMQLFKHDLIEYSFTCKIKGYFNSEELDYRNILDYSKLFFTEEQIKNHFVRFIWEKIPPEFEKVTPSVLAKKVAEAKKVEHIPLFEAIVIDTPDNGKTLSFVNGLVTVDNGSHVDSIQEPIVKYVIEQLKSKKKNENRKFNPRKIKIKNHLSFIVNARVPNPHYGSQSKTKLASPSFGVDIPEDILKKMNKWDLFDRLNAEMDAIDFKNASASDGKKKPHISCNRGQDANEAGKKESKKCTLFLCEGDSASNYPKARIPMLDGGKDYHGYLPLKGVLLNVTKATNEQYAKNQVIADIKTFLGLQEGVDYNLQVNLDNLRYGKVSIITDADNDGMHILSLIIDFFREKYKGLLQQNIISYLRTPMIRVYKISGKKKTKVATFFNQKSFDEWYAQNDTKNLEIKYLKGLGSSDDSEIKDDLTTAPTVICFFDSSADKNLDVAFSKDGANERKKWIAEYRDKFQTDDVISIDIASIINSKKLTIAQDISQLINRELVGYSVASLSRAIISEYDLLKQSQRKIIYAALVYFNYNPYGKKQKKTAQFAADVASMVGYHHGEDSLKKAIIIMAQDFVGSNNMAFFRKGGQFGTRSCGGKSAADPRYNFVHLNWWVPYVYEKESIDLVEKRIVDGEECEPFWLPAVVPMAIINGGSGIATGFSFQLPGHEPDDVANYLIAKCEGKEPDPIVPWYNGFKGKLQIVDRDKNEINIDDEILPGDLNSDKPLGLGFQSVEDYDQEDLDKTGRENIAILKHLKDSKLRLTTYGKFQLIGEHRHGPVLRITEVPVGCWLDNYYKWLESLRDTKGANVKHRPIYNCKDNSTTDRADFTIEWNSKWKPATEANLRLIKSIGMSNITLIDHNGFPTKYDNVEAVLEKYYSHMIKHYEEVRKARIVKEEKNMIDIDYKMKLIELCAVKKVIKYQNVKVADIKKQLEEHKIPYSYFDKTKLTDLSEEDIEKYKNKIQEAKDRLEIAQKTTAAQIWISKLKIFKEQIAKRRKGKGKTKFYNFSDM